jgi:hypothetical protein
MAKRILNRKDLRADYDAAERRREDDDQDEEEEVDEEEEEEAETEEEAGDKEEEEEAEEEKKPKKKKVKPKAEKKPRSRAAKIVRMKVVWGVFDNSNRCVATFDYPKRKEADDLVAKLTTEKKNTHFIQPVKEPMEEKKEK